MQRRGREKTKRGLKKMRMGKDNIFLKNKEANE
jgi:hypothetical protein